MKDWFAVDKDGLGKLLAERGAPFAVLELVQNALDTKAKHVSIDLTEKADGLYSLVVTDDDPSGFSDLAHSFTLFAESEKKGKANLRGRFNLGEKLVLALCESATIRSTKGSVYFDADGRHETPAATERGSVIDLVIRLTSADALEVERLVKTILFPEVVNVTFNGAVLDPRKAVEVVSGKLPTVAARANGTLYNTVRKTSIRLVQPAEGETAHLYELGIPVVEIDLPFHADVQQKVPVGFSRDAVNPAYARALSVAIVNEAPDLLVRDDTAGKAWAADALADPSISPEAVRAIIEAKYGKSADLLVRYDPSDPQSKTEAQSQGLDVVGGRAFTPEQWANINKAGLLPAAGKVAPSRNAITARSPEAEAVELVVLNDTDYTADQRAATRYAVALGTALLDGKQVTVRIVRDKAPYVATWGTGRVLSLNVAKIRKAAWKDEQWLDDVILHEVAHQFASDHLDHRFYEAAFRLGAKARSLDVATIRLSHYTDDAVAS